VIALLRYFWVLLLLLGAAVVGVWLRHDPGLLFIRLRGWELRTTLLFGVLLLLLALVLVWLLWWLLLRMPQRMRERARQRRLRDLDMATLARIEGRPRLAEKLYERAAEHPLLRSGALLQAAESALAHADPARAQTYLERAAPYPSARPSVRLIGLAIRGHDAQRQADLEALAQATNPPPAALLALAGLYADQGDWEALLRVLDQARRSKSLPLSALDELRRSVLPTLLGRVADSEALLAVWRGAGDKTLRRQPAVIAALAQAERRLGHEGLAADALEAALKREWDEALAELYAEVPLGSTSKLLRRAEQRLATHPESPGLLLALARLCRRDELWGKARDYLNLALAKAPSAAAWEEWAELNEQIGDPAQARRGYRNALRLSRGEAIEPSSVVA
jgi:HemY protein